MLKKYVRLALCTLLPVLILAGCGSRSGSNTNEERTLVFSHWDVENQEIYQTLAQEYMKEHTGLTIEVQAIAPDKYNAAWLKSISDNKAADVFAVPAGDDFQIFAGSGKLMDLGKKSDLLDNYDSALAQIGSQDGHTWAVPVKGSVPVVFFNKAYIQQCNLVSPLTISDFIVNCSILQQNGILPFGMSKNDAGQYDTADFIEGIMANGPCDTPLLSSGQFFDKNTELDSGFIDAVGLAYELTISELLVAKENSVQGHQALLEQFAQGAYAMIPGDTNDIAKLREHGGDFSFGFFPMPGSDTSLTGVFKADMMLGILKNTKLDEDAKGFVSYLLSPASQEFLCNETYTIPVSDNVQLTDADLATAQTLLNGTGGRNPSLFQRISKDEKSICLGKLDLVYSGSAENYDEFMQDWINRLKELK
jgi:raffinose/stachyose/melibiose transport system substrate-binding protein